jgi:hypothetical protein
MWHCAVLLPPPAGAGSDSAAPQTPC